MAERRCKCAIVQLSESRAGVEWCPLHANAEKMRELLTEIRNSIPATYDEKDPSVQRHARALNSIPALLAETETAK